MTTGRRITARRCLWKTPAILVPCTGYQMFVWAGVLLSLLLATVWRRVRLFCGLERPGFGAQLLSLVLGAALVSCGVHAECFFSCPFLKLWTVYFNGWRTLPGTVRFALCMKYLRVRLLVSTWWLLPFLHLFTWDFNERFVCFSLAQERSNYGVTCCSDVGTVD